MAMLRIHYFEVISMHIRLGDVRDWPFVYSLSREVIPASVSPWRKQPMEETLKYRDQFLKGYWPWIQRTDSKVFIAEDQDESGQAHLIGYLVLHPTAWEELTGIIQGWIMDVAVLPAWRGKGVGKSLLQAAERYCRDNGIHYLGLAVSTHNVKALNLYQENGFIEERKLMVKVLEK